jgi:F-type H+-transporting ATPase subunit gamma
METLEFLQRRIAVSRDLQAIVRTMKTLSAVTIRRCERTSRSVRSYDETVDAGLQILLRDPEVARMAIGASEAALDSGPLGLIVLGSDHGLCGRFNSVAVKTALDELHGLKSGAVVLAAVGDRAADLLEAAGWPPAAVYATPGSVTGIRATTGALLALIDGWRRDEGIERVRIVHTVQSRGTPVRPVALGLLPISPAFLAHQAARPWPSRRLPTFTESRDLMLSRLLREHVFVRLYRALAEAQVSEHAARLAAMQSAERGIRDHLDEMNADYRRRRQEQITTELLDVVAGAAALRSSRR